MLRRAICYDVTHLVTRLGIPAPSGIDQVDLAYARHFVERGLGPFVHYGLATPHVLSHERGKVVAETALSPAWARADVADTRFTVLRSAILDRTPAFATAKSQRDHSIATLVARARAAADRLRFRVAHDGPRLPGHSIYLNVAQHMLEYKLFFSWLERRPDILPVFMIHDLLPLDYPEYFRPGYETRFDRRLSTALKHGRAFIVTSQAVRERLVEELAARKLPERPVLVAPLPSSLATDPYTPLRDEVLAREPYFVVVGTIEPRKNHLLLVNVWSSLASRNADAPDRVPQLVVVGGRGWENEQVLDFLDRSPIARRYIHETKGLPPTDLTRLIANARALLVPSWSEGYGIPLVEALGVGTPVIATDAPVFREVTKGCATYLSPIDGIGWRDEISKLAAASGADLDSMRGLAARFKAPTWSNYFEQVEAFLEAIS